MSNRRQIRRARASYTKKVKVQQYYEMLLATGMHEREAMRAAVYADVKGFDEMATHNGADGCLVFDVPECGNLDCLNPDHQRFVP